ncbi:MAG: hypothetical protein M3R38_18565 [Actinomycetota bacterium]|nr:hypothetical protein [Actinomycetota bacterium]PLS87455.1 MAG: hypothetical protein CYG60_01800 [Actinomycetota bacterium]
MREVKGATQAEWDGWLEGSPGGGHVYHTHEWGEFKRRLGWYPVRLVLEREGAVAGVGQFLCRSVPFFPGKLMYATKGPWLLWDDEGGRPNLLRGRPQRCVARGRAHG